MKKGFCVMLQDGEDLSLYDEDILSKGRGEGSRGGHIIGHTPSGRAIYAPSQSKKNKGKDALIHRQSKGEALHKYSDDDHKTFITSHMEESDKHQAEYKKTKDHYHRAMSDAHFKAASNHHMALHGERKMNERPTPVRKPWRR